MKKKSRFLVHIALIALSLCIMVYGVYAAKQAQLTVTGTIGFTAHNGAVDVQLTGISGAYDVYHNKVVMGSATTGQVALDGNSTTTVTAGSTANNLTIKTATTKQTGDTTDYGTNDVNLTALYFDDVENSTATQDVITNIVFTFTATNKALFAMKLNEDKLTGNALTGGRVTYAIGWPADATNSMNAGTKGTDNNVTGGGTLTFTITLTLASKTPDAPTMENLTAAAFSVPVEFIKA